MQRAKDRHLKDRRPRAPQRPKLGRVWRGVKHPLLPWLLLCGLVLALTNLYPLLRLLERVFFDREGLTWANLSWLASSTQVRIALFNSLFVSTAAAFVALALGLVLALVIHKTDLPGRHWVRLAFLFPLILPPQILALAWLQWAGPVGYLQKSLRWLFDLPGPLWTLYGPGGVIVLLTLFVLPVSMLTIGAGLARIARSTEEAATMEGATSWQAWRYIVIPLLKPHLTAAMILCFLGALGNFGIPALLAIPAQYSTLPTLIYRQVTSFSAGGLGQSAALALLLGLPAVVVLWLQGSILGRSDYRTPSDSGEETLGYRLGGWRWPLWCLLAALVGLVMLGPVLAMVATGLLRAYGLPLSWENITLEHFRFVLFDLDRARRAAYHSLLLAGGAALLCTALAALLGYALARFKGKNLSLLKLVIDLPYALPGLVFALALILVWLPSPLPGFQLYGTLWLLFIAYLGRFLAFALQPVTAAWHQLDSSLEEAATVDGASLMQTFRYVLLPLIAPSLVVAALLVFLQALAELTLSALLAGSGTETLGWLVFGLEQGGYSSQAAALSTLLLLVLLAAAGGVALLRRPRNQKERAPVSTR